MIFKQASCEEELYESMEKAQLEAVAKEEQREGELFLEAMQELNAAAECFERAGRTSRAKEVTQVMISLSSAVTNIDQILSVIQGWAGGDITAQKSGNTIEVWSWGVPKDQKQVVETNMKNSLESYLQGQGITTTVPIIYQAVSTPSFDTDNNNDNAVTNIDQILSVIQGWAGGDITAQKSGNTIEVWSWGVPKDQKQVVETNMKNSLESYLQGQGITTTVPIIYQAVSTPSFDTDDNNDKTAKKSSKDEVKKVFMFFGFGPEDLKGLDSSNGDTGDGE